MFDTGFQEWWACRVVAAGFVERYGSILRMQDCVIDISRFELVVYERHHTITDSPSTERFQHSHPFNLGLTIVREPEPGGTNYLLVVFDD